MKNDNISRQIKSRHLVVGIVISLLLILSWFYYKNDISITQKTYTISSMELRKSARLDFIVPLLNKHLSVGIYSEDELCKQYITDSNISIKLIDPYQTKNMGQYWNFDLYHMKKGDKFSILFESNNTLKNCNVRMEIDDTALDLLLFVLLYFIPAGVLIGSLFILLYRIFKNLFANKRP